MTKPKLTKPDPKRGVARHPDTGVEGAAAGLFAVEHGRYTAVVIWRSRAKSERKATERTFVSSYAGRSARALAAKMRNAGWRPPRGLARMCEAAPSSTWE